MSFVSTLISFWGAVAFFPDDVHELIGKGNVEIIRMIAEAGGQIPPADRHQQEEPFSLVLRALHRD